MDPPLEKECIALLLEHAYASETMLGSEERAFETKKRCVQILQDKCQWVHRPDWVRKFTRTTTRQRGNRREPDDDWAEVWADTSGTQTAYVVLRGSLHDGGDRVLDRAIQKGTDMRASRADRLVRGCLSLGGCASAISFGLRRIVLVGHSSGGTIALDAALRCGVDAVLVNPGASEQSVKARAQKWTSDPNCALSSTKCDLVVYRHAQDELSSSVAKDPFVASRCEGSSHIVNEAPVKGKLGILRGVASVDMCPHDYLAGLGLPSQFCSRNILLNDKSQAKNKRPFDDYELGIPNQKDPMVIGPRAKRIRMPTWALQSSLVKGNRYWKSSPFLVDIDRGFSNHTMTMVSSSSQGISTQNNRSFANRLRF